MKRRPIWLLPLLTGLFIAAAALVPQGLSRLGDRRTGSAVHSEPLTGDNNFSVWSPSIAERIELIVQWQEGRENIFSASQEVTGEEREGLQTELRTELAVLVKDGIVPDGADPERFAVTFAERYDLWTENDLGGVSVLSVSAYDELEDWYLYALVDEESGRMVWTELLWPGMMETRLTPAEAGADYLDLLGVEHRLRGASAGDYQAFYLLYDSEIGFRCVSNGSLFMIQPDTAENIDLIYTELVEYEARMGNAAVGG